MTPHLQTVLAIAIVIATAAALIWRVVARRGASCGSEGCGAISADARAFRRKLGKS